MAKGKLPKKLSDLIRLALTDLRKVERNPKYKVDMNTWHTPNGVCRVCLAGAVMAGTLGASRENYCSPEAFRADADKLSALDEARNGDFYYALRFMHQHIATGEDDYKYDFDKKLGRIPVYHPRNKNKFHAAMRKAATKLAKLGY